MSLATEFNFIFANLAAFLCFLLSDLFRIISFCECCRMAICYPLSAVHEKHNKRSII